MTLMAATLMAANAGKARLTAAVLAALFSTDLVHGQDAKGDTSSAVSLTTIHDEKLRAELVAITDGKLVLKTEPPRAIPLDELDRVDFDKATAASALNALGKPAASVKATSSTNHERKVGASAPAATPASDPSTAAAGGDARAIVVHLEGLGELSGKLEALGQESLRLETATAGVVEVPLLAARGVWFQSAGEQGGGAAAKAKDLFTKRLNSPGNEDTALVRGEDQLVTEIAGQILQLKDQKLQFKYEGEARSINITRVAGLVFAAHAKNTPTDRPYQVFELAGGNRLSGSWTGFADGALEVQAAWGGKLKIPAAKAAAIVFRNGKLVYLSDLAPASVEEVPYFDRTMPYQKDKNLLGEPLKLKGKEHRKGLAVHSRSVLNYSLEGKYAQFKSLVGFDDSVPARGRVVCRVLADGKPIFSEADLRADAKPKPVELDVKGVRQLTLEIDFGEDENICDRVIWADARLYRE